MVNIPVPHCLLKLRKKDEMGANSKRDIATCDANRIRSSSVDLMSGRYIFTISVRVERMFFCFFRANKCNRLLATIIGIKSTCYLPRRGRERLRCYEKVRRLPLRTMN